jgi:hypothetical protein
MLKSHKVWLEGHSIWRKQAYGLQFLNSIPSIQQRGYQHGKLHSERTDGKRFETLNTIQQVQKLRPSTKTL